MIACPNCGHRYEALADTAVLVADLRERCHGLGIAVLPGDLVREADMARLLQISERTARSWRELHAVIPFRRVGRKVTYSLPTLAQYLARDRQ